MDAEWPVTISGTNEPSYENNPTAWAEWARNRILDLMARLGAQAETVQRLSNENEALEGQLKAAEAWMARLRDRTRHTLDIGAEVTFGPSKLKGKVEQAVLDKEGVYYGVAWWDGGRRVVTSVPADELEEAGDILPYPPVRQ